MDQDFSMDQEFEDEDENHHEFIRLVKGFIRGRYKLNLETTQEQHDFLLKYSEYFDSSDSGTVLHIALNEYCRARHIISDEPKDGYLDRLKLLLQPIISSHPTLLKKRDHWGQTPLQYAIQKGLSCLIEFMCSCNPEAAATALSYRGRRGQNSVHAAIEAGLELKSVDYLISICEVDALTATDENGNTPIHVAVSSNRIGGNELEALTRRRKNPGKERISKRDEQKKVVLSSNTSPSPVYETFEEGDGAISQNLTSTAEISGQTQSCSLLSVIERLIEKNPSALRITNKAGKTPYQLRLHHRRRSDNAQLRANGEKFLEYSRADAQAMLIATYCMENFHRNEIMTCLYKPGEGMSR